jgi:hypothetical protein
MRSAVAIGWMVVAVLGFISGNLLNLSPQDALAQLGMGLYAVLLTVSLVMALLNGMSRHTGGKEGRNGEAGGKRGVGRLPMTLLMLGIAVAHAQQEAGNVLEAPLDPVFPVRFTAAVEREGYREYRLEFPSARISPYPANNTVYARWLVPQSAPSSERLPAVILLHSLGIRQPTLELALARELVQHGIAVLLLTLPYHMERTPPGSESGDLVLQGDVPLLRETLIQAVWDVRRAVDWLSRQPGVDGARVGLVGISLGAILGAAALSAEPRLHSAVLILGGVDLAHILWHSILALRTRIRLQAQGYTLQRLRDAIADVEPMYRLTPELGEKSFVIGAQFDIVVPTEDTEKLVRALGHPRVFWLNTGHFGGALVQRPLFRMVRRYLVARFTGAVPPVESSPLVPTVRIGAIYGYERDFRLAAGVDLWRLDRRGTLFITAVLTPRGSSLFAGVRLRLGFSAGVEITARRTTGALFWHFVL